MKKIKKLKLNVLNKESLEAKELQQIHGGNYCYWSEENRKANDTYDVCSCGCGTYTSGDYYSDDNLHQDASFFKYTTGW